MPYGLGQLFTVIGLEIISMIASDFTKYRYITSNHRQTILRGFDQGQTKAFDVGGCNEGVGTFVCGA